MNLASDYSRGRRYQRMRGFTLIEALIAMFIVALALVAVTTKVSLAAKIASRTQQSTYGRWVAMNAITELRLKPGLPATGSSDGDEDMAGQQFRWDMDIKNTPVEGLRRVDVSVASSERPDEVLYEMSAFLGTNNPNANLRPWAGLPDEELQDPNSLTAPGVTIDRPSRTPFDIRDNQVQPNR
ncbi:MAG: type II secretion system minor pseudopilin GspI [Gammaproteobacteria bacterium]|nr:type II secretion system minor pseudopilin GspI [Gammaproteobacteria bacterium]